MTTHDKVQRIRSILNRVWNPIGLTLSAEDNEYDDYVAYIARRSVWKEKELIDYLLYVENNHIGLSIGAERKAVARLTAQEIMAVPVAVPEDSSRS